METMNIFSGNSKQREVSKNILTFLVFMILFSVQAMAETSLEEEQAQAARKELWSYIFMGVGFALVIFIAFYTTMKSKNDDAATHHHGDHDHSHHHHHNHSAEKHDPAYHRKAVAHRK